MRQHKILFVDDEPALLEGIRNALRRQPYDVMTATSAVEALELLAHGNFDVVVSDERMPGMSGSQFVGFVRERHPEVVRIMLTGQASLESAIHAVNQGEVFRILLKPCHPVELAQTIQNAIELKELRTQSSILLAETRRRGAIIQNLEKRHPGISGHDIDTAGVIHIDDEETPDLETLIRAMRDEVAPPA